MDRTRDSTQLNWIALSHTHPKKHSLELFSLSIHLKALKHPLSIWDPIHWRSQADVSFLANLFSPISLVLFYSYDFLCLKKEKKNALVRSLNLFTILFVGPFSSLLVWLTKWPTCNVCSIQAYRRSENENGPRSSVIGIEIEIKVCVVFGDRVELCYRWTIFGPFNFLSLSLLSLASRVYSRCCRLR